MAPWQKVTNYPTKYLSIDTLLTYVKSREILTLKGLSVEYEGWGHSICLPSRNCRVAMKNVRNQPPSY